MVFHKETLLRMRFLCCLLCYGISQRRQKLYRWEQSFVHYKQNDVFRKLSNETNDFYNRFSTIESSTTQNKLEFIIEYIWNSFNNLVSWTSYWIYMKAQSMWEENRLILEITNKYFTRVILDLQTTKYFQEIYMKTPSIESWITPKWSKSYIEKFPELVPSIMIY